MKAKIRKTGEIVDIISHSGDTVRSNILDRVSYIDSKGVEHDREELNYYWDFEQIPDVKEDNFPKIDWEQRRYEIAKSIYPEIIKATHPRDAAGVGNTTVLFADVLIKALKGETEQEKEEPKEHKHEAVEVKIGSTIQIEGVDYVCLNAGDNDCCLCDFLIDGDCASPSWLKCHSECRKDGKDVMFIKKGGSK